MTTTPTAPRVLALIAYAHARIDECRAVERKFAEAQIAADRLASARGRRPSRLTPHAVIEAETERMTWQRAMEMLGVERRLMSEEMRHAEAERIAEEGGSVPLVENGGG
jgi:hypothetical protein